MVAHTILWPFLIRRPPLSIVDGFLIYWLGHQLVAVPIPTNVMRVADGGRVEGPVGSEDRQIP